MPDVRLTEARQRALRALLAAEAVPGRPLPSREVFDALARLVPCDLLGATLSDPSGTVLDEVFLAAGARNQLKAVPSPVGPVIDHGGPFYAGWIHWTRRPELAAECCDLLGVDDLAIGFHNGPDVVQLGFVRETVAFTDEELALLRLVTPVLGRLTSERPAPQLPASLTASERRVLGHVAAGRSNPEIAVALCVEECTVRKHLENTYRKLGVSNRVAAVARLASTGVSSAAVAEGSATFA